MRPETLDLLSLPSALLTSPRNFAKLHIPARHQTQSRLRSLKEITFESHFMSIICDYGKKFWREMILIDRAVCVRVLQK